MRKFVLKNQKIGYSWYWLDKNIFVFDFGDGEFTDVEGDDFFHYEYHLDNNNFIFEIYWEDSFMSADRFRI